MTWIKLNASLRTNPKLLTLASRLGVTPVTAMGAICHAWMIADEHADESGALPHMEPGALDSLIGIDGLAETMRSVGWLEVSGDGLLFPDYQQHNGTTAKSRAQAQKRQMRCRQRHAAASKQVVTPPRDEGVTREEESRVEKNREEKKGETNKPTRAPTPDRDGGAAGVDAPCSIAQARSRAEQNGHDPEIAETWWHECDARGWIDAKGHRLRKWQSGLAGYCRKWIANENRRSRNSGREPPAGDAGSKTKHAQKSKAFGF